MRGATDRTLKTIRVVAECSLSSRGASTPRRAPFADVLLGPAENFRWLPTSAISRATLESGASFDSRARPRPARELVSIYEEAGVVVH